MAGLTGRPETTSTGDEDGCLDGVFVNRSTTDDRVGCVEGSKVVSFVGEDDGCFEGSEVGGNDGEDDGEKLGLTVG